jgi:hypothetical protein
VVDRDCHFKLREKVTGQAMYAAIPTSHCAATMVNVWLVIKRLGLSPME